MLEPLDQGFHKRNVLNSDVGQDSSGSDWNDCTQKRAANAARFLVGAAD